VALACHIDAVERLDRRLRLAFGGAEGGEIMLADKRLSGPMHRRVIERHRKPPGPAALEGQGCRPIGDAIEIGAADGLETRVEVVRHRFDREHAYRMRAQM